VSSAVHGMLRVIGCAWDVACHRLCMGCRRYKVGVCGPDFASFESTLHAPPNGYGIDDDNSQSSWHFAADQRVDNRAHVTSAISFLLTGLTVGKGAQPLTDVML
jgi:hypothetical protein